MSDGDSQKKRRSVDFCVEGRKTRGAKQLPAAAIIRLLSVTPLVEAKSAPFLCQMLN